MTAPDLVFAYDALVDWACRLLTTVGLPGERARVIAESLAIADARGLGSHGLSRLGIYIERLRRGLVEPGAELTTIKETIGSLVLDAGNGFGHPMAAEAIQRGIDKAKLSGVCAVAVRNSTHFGIAGYFAEIAARQGCIGIVTANSAPRMAPWGGKEAMFGTNPLAVGIPCGAEPILLDMSTSVAALGKIVLAQQAGMAIPENWAQDVDGNPTTDAAAALDGTLLPAAGAKGSGMALIFDILSGVLSGGRFGPEVASLYRDMNQPEGCGHFFILLDVAAFMELDLFERCVAGYAARIRASAPISADRPVLLPGDLERQRETRSKESGIRIPLPAYRALLKIAEENGVEFPDAA